MRYTEDCHPRKDILGVPLGILFTLISFPRVLILNHAPVDRQEEEAYTEGRTLFIAIVYALFLSIKRNLIPVFKLA